MVGTHNFFIIFFSGKNYIVCILKGISPFKMHKIIYFPENLKKVYLDFISKFRFGRVTLNMGIFLGALLSREMGNKIKKTCQEKKVFVVCDQVLVKPI